MSVNITVNGKFSKQSQVSDPEGYKKQLEYERRKLRLQQVRAQSKELARKIRTDVSQEKERQLRNLEAVKAQELDLWRKNVVAQKNIDYRSALDQVGRAHLAARKEKEAEKEKKIIRENELSREKERGRIAITKELLSPQRQPTSSKIQTERPKTQKKYEKGHKRVSYEAVEPKGGQKHERIYVCFDEKFESCSCSIDTDSDDQWSTDEIIETCDLMGFSSSSTSIGTSSQRDTKSTQTETSKETSLKRAPPVLLDVAADPIESEVIVAPDHVVDKHIETNRQFDSVVSMDPKKDTAATQTEGIISTVLMDTESVTRPRYTQISDLIAKQKSAEIIATQKESRSMTIEPISERVSTVTSSASFIVEKSGASSTAPSVTAEKTVPPNMVTSIIAEKATPAVMATSVTTEKALPPVMVAPLATEKITSSATVPAFIAEEFNAPKVSRSFPTTRIATVQRKSIQPYPTRLSRPSRISTISGGTTSSSKDTGDRSEGAGSFVQFYDYNNKYAKEYSHPPDAVAVPQKKKTELNAMEQAALENRKLNGREKKNEKLRQKSEERGKAALEREKVRRDCVNLTEKLDALMQKRQRILPTDANLHSNAYFAEKAARKEAKMNSAIEELLSRPAIITCPDRRREMPRSSHNVQNHAFRQPNSSDLNLGSRLCSGESDNAACKSTDTEDSGSILLGYIDGQRDQIRNELTQCDDSPARNAEKKDKLTQLLKRIETLRESLLKELNRNSEKESVPIGDAQIPKDLSQPYEGLNVAFKKKEETQKQPGMPERLDERERILKEREIKLQKELAQVIQTQKKLKTEQGISGSGSSTAKSTAIKIKAGKEQQIIERTTTDKPLEIVIKVKGNKKDSKRKCKSVQDKDSAPQEKPTTPPTVPLAIRNESSAAGNRRGSYDSNSTAYQSMPSALPGATEQFVDRIQQLESNNKQRITSTDTSRSTSCASAEQRRVEAPKHPKSHLNPLIAQYVQRLLGMSRESVMALEVSSSDIITPSSSVMNITTNLASSGGSSSILSEDHLQRVERFVNENRSFITELEESIRTHSNVPLETSLRRFDEIWKQKFEHDLVKDTTRKQTGPILKVPKVQEEKERSKRVVQEITTKNTQSVAQKAEKIAQRKLQVKDLKVTKTSARVVNKDTAERKELHATETQLNEYAELTKNCSNRIAELTALITKVRQEKQRILEVTLTSVSDNERNSTEYAELPAGQKNRETRSESNSTDSTQKNFLELPPPSSAVDLELKTEQEAVAAPLEKHKQTGRSRDSGISMPSRPVTALGHDAETEPPSYASSAPTNTNTTTQSSSTHRKARPPPPTLHRYSPQLPEDDLVHELSTIVEVDTPATSRINTSVQPLQSERQQPSGRPAVAFPTFEEYVKELNLDLTILDPEQSLRMEHEYNELIEALKDGQGNKAYNYEEYPTLISYLKNVTGNEQVCQSPETIEDLFGCLRLATIIAKPFPTHKEYVERLHHNSPNEKYLDSESLENLTELQSIHSETESETLNIQAELKRRNILKQSFRSSSTKYDVLSTSTGRHEALKPSSQSTTYETGIEKLTSSTTDSASEKFQRELLALGLKWHKPMRCKEKETAALSSSTSDSLPMNATNEKSKLPSKTNEKKNESGAGGCLSDSESSDQPLNLRDFLTRQLLKHVAATSSCDSSLSGESLRSQFFMAVLDSMTPSGSPRTNTNTNIASQNTGQPLERQKTSTPVRTSTMQSHAINEHSKSNEASQPQFFSGESSLSFVQVPEHKRSSKKKS